VSIQKLFVDGLFRQLLAVGYFRIWATPEFGASEEEVGRLTSLTPVTSLGPLGTADEILGLQVCHTGDQSDLEAKEESQIRSYEDAISRLLFREGAGERLRECPLVASGEFGQFAVRQVRGNVGEHAKATLGLSMVRLVHPATEHDSWGVPKGECPCLIADGELGAPKLGNGPPTDDVYVCLTAMDDGLGIHQHLRYRWGQECLGDEPAARRVLARLAACPDYGAIGDEARPFVQTVEFATDSEGTSKKRNERSPETPGLYRLDCLAARERGILEITSGRWRIRHASGKLTIKACERALPLGTLVRVWMPLTRGEETTPQHRRAPRGHIRHMVGVCGASGPPDIVFLSDEWDQASIPPGLTLEERIQRFADLVRDEVDAIIRADGQSTAQRPTAVFLDWSELRWREHESSLFLRAIRRWYRVRTRPETPVIPVNVPERLLLLAKGALVAFAADTDPEEPEWRGPLPFYLCTDQGNAYWYGISGNGNLDANTAHAVGRTLDAALGKSIVYEDQKSGRFTREQIAALAETVKRQCPLFSESTTRDTSTGLDAPSGSFLPVVSYEKIQERIGATFTGKLHKRLLAQCMLRRKSTVHLRGQEWAYIRLPNGALADKYFRCDLLLSAPRTARGSAATDMSGRLGFERSLSSHLVELAKAMEERLAARFDLVASCTSPNHWFVHQIADGLTDRTHNCGHFVARSRTSFAGEFGEFAERHQVRPGSLVLIFTDVISNCGTVQTMRRILADAELRIGGVIALLDTRNEERMGRTADEGSLGIRGLPDDCTVILAREKVSICAFRPKRPPIPGSKRTVYRSVATL